MAEGRKPDTESHKQITAAMSLLEEVFSLRADISLMEVDGINTAIAPSPTHEGPSGTNAGDEVAWVLLSGGLELCRITGCKPLEGGLSGC
ncbi:hypothetical protein R1sor_024559 [Riccia sorocarpa]|uniref:Uncharacterized protein n=1 Tax=Riccia sorocarpa TaxID=122646 RepID=A0ABD3GQW6_9MARC